MCNEGLFLCRNTYRVMTGNKIDSVECKCNGISGAWSDNDDGGTSESRRCSLGVERTYGLEGEFDARGGRGHRVVVVRTVEGACVRACVPSRGLMKVKCWS